MISDALHHIQKNLEPAEIFVLDLKPDEIQDQQPKDASQKLTMLDRISGYREDLKAFDQTINNVHYTSEILLKTNLEKKMWGSKDMMDLIHASRSDMTKLAEDFNRSECIIEHSDDYARLIQAALARRLTNASIKETTGKMIENFSFLKSFMSRLAQDLQALYSIDKDFKSRVGYPATWFFNPSIFMNFTYEYENLIDHLMKTASLEADIIEPLMLWKMTGV